MELCQCENKSDIQTGIVVCTVCGLNKMEVPTYTSSKESTELAQSYLDKIKDTPTP